MTPYCRILLFATLGMTFLPPLSADRALSDQPSSPPDNKPANEPAQPSDTPTAKPEPPKLSTEPKSSPQSAPPTSEPPPERDADMERAAAIRHNSAIRRRRTGCSCNGRR